MSFIVADFQRFGIVLSVKRAVYSDIPLFSFPLYSVNNKATRELVSTPLNGRLTRVVFVGMAGDDELTIVSPL